MVDYSFDIDSGIVPITGGDSPLRVYGPLPVGQFIVGQTAVQLAVFRSARASIAIKALTSNDNHYDFQDNAKPHIFIGNSAAVTEATGYQISFKGAVVKYPGIGFEIEYSGDLWAIAPVGSPDIKVSVSESYETI